MPDSPDSGRSWDLTGDLDWNLIQKIKNDCSQSTGGVGWTSAAQDTYHTCLGVVCNSFRRFLDASEPILEFVSIFLHYCNKNAVT